MFYPHHVRVKNGYKGQVMVVSDLETGQEPDSDRIVWESPDTFIDIPNDDPKLHRYGWQLAQEAAKARIDRFYSEAFSN